MIMPYNHIQVKQLLNGRTHTRVNYPIHKSKEEKLTFLIILKI